MSDDPVTSEMEVARVCGCRKCLQLLAAVGVEVIEALADVLAVLPFDDRHWDSEYRLRHYHVCDRGCTQLRTCRYHEALTTAQKAVDEWRL